MNTLTMYLRGSMGLGNQMYIYATGYSVSKKLGMKLNIDASKILAGGTDGRFFELENFNIEYNKIIRYPYKYNKIWDGLGMNRLLRKICTGLTVPVYIEDESIIYDEHVFDIKKSTCLDGNWNNYRYFIDCRNDLQRLLSPKRKLTGSALQFQKMIADEENSISLHIRRGDYLNIPDWALPFEYYEKALDKVKERFGPDTAVFIFSDDINFCRQKFEGYEKDFRISYVDYESENRTVDDLYLMSTCKNNIIANSTYSWWAAFLNSNADSIVICPCYRQWNQDVYLPEWIKIMI